jgi:glycosyltransferase involved in cell wall biosynthesis
MNRISIIIPSLQNNAMLHQAVRSVLTGSGLDSVADSWDVECIVIANWQERVLPEELPLGDPRFRLHFFKTETAADAMNAGMELATGSVIGVLSSDDEYLPGALAEVARCFSKNAACDAVYGKVNLVDLSSRPIRSERVRHPRFRSLCQGLCLNPSATFYRRPFIDRIGKFNNAYKYRTHFDFLVQAFAAGCQFSPLASVVTGKRIHSGNTVSNRNDHRVAVESLREVVSIIDAHLGVAVSRWNLRLARALAALNRQDEYEGIELDRHIIANALSEYQKLHHVDATELKRVRNQFLRLHFSRQLFSSLKQPTKAIGLLPFTKKRKRGRRLFRLRYQAPEPCYLPSFYFAKTKLKYSPSIGIVTPNLNQGAFIERTIRSVIDQEYPNLQYTIQDAVSRDSSVQIIRKYESRLSSWQSVKDRGQSHAINLGLARIDTEIMAYLNSDDVLFPGSLSCVAQYFSAHPEVDVVYGNRLLIDDNDQVINRWVLPRHDNEAITWADYIPQETLFWRRRAWDAVGGQVDDSFQFAMDWDLILRFRQAGMRFARIPRFLGAFRITELQKTGALIASTGLAEMTRLRRRELGRTPSDIEVSRMLKGYMRRQWYADKWQSVAAIVQVLTGSGIDWTATQASMRPEQAARIAA